jgi:putative ABC transport system ATP-binding protein
MLSMKEISVTFNENTPNEVRALQNVSLDIDEGDFITVIGANGAGKSTLFNVIAGTVDVDDGMLMLYGRNITDMTEYLRSKYIGRVFQNPSLGTCPGLTIRENLSLAAMRGKIPTLRRDLKKSQEDWFMEQLKAVNLGLEDRLDTDVSLLSGGQRQAITLIMATLMKPKVLLLDEHTAALDPNAADKVIGLTIQLAEEHNLTVVMITHSMQQACMVGNRVVMMNRGNILFEIAGDERAVLRPSDLVERFRSLQTGVELADRTLLS